MTHDRVCKIKQVSSIQIRTSPNAYAVLSNMESINALLKGQNLPQNERLVQLNKIEIAQMRSLTESNITKKLM